MSVRIFCMGEIVGKAGVFCVKTLLKDFRKEKQIDLVVANGEGTTGGFGLGKNHSIYLHKLGINVITGGECIYYKRDMVSHIRQAPYILRPANYPPGNPGRGWWIYQVGEHKVGVISLLGQSGFRRVHLSNPFSFLPSIVEKIRKETPVILLDFHAATTAEKYTMFYHADGQVSAVAGTHNKALSADEAILPRGTGIICDTGRTGSIDSVGGLEIETEIGQFISQIPERSKEAWGGLEMQGVIFEINAEGRTTAVERVRIPCKEVPDERKSDS
ncbi:TIGR00282 family metallophosphoesterase [Marispirochaeta sp.]|uniref:TIGR00282 family metallophosphoesterase n=1 Tax=Marispirochaeta sp. TaxID=2038653 RepID=UPI0029C80D04|nr:TIGR00282 family metallophosphoesterase [Marispirochaeta sp.]